MMRQSVPRRGTTCFTDGRGGGSRCGTLKRPESVSLAGKGAGEKELCKEGGGGAGGGRIM